MNGGKRILLFCLAALLALSLCACGGESQSGGAQVNMSQLQQAMLAADPSLQQMTSVTSEAADGETLFAYVSALPYDKVESFLLSYSSAGKADELAVIAVKDSKDVEEAAQSLRDHVQQRLQLFRQYGPDQAARVEQAQVFTKDNCAVLIIADQSQAVREALEQTLSARA